ncbi:hypothetical protein K2173_026712 [Erythroxylum novogranatense]|uniref:B-like cyclin n=1 Tax=Erythroxylum novogranatense TaxID=1862640 RepID=A0AAV8TX33_9ROSI|nr:hypothetical protein K2173_026712 [Erythroxylum novogranatense]
MASSFDCGVSSLLCAEDNSCILDDTDYHGVEMEEFEVTWRHKNGRFPYNQSRACDGRDAGLPLQSEECVALMIEKECQHLPNADYSRRLRTGELDMGARGEAVHWIGKVHAYFGFAPLCSYLSINYLDRFLSAYELPKGKDWMMQLLAVACLSLAAKMEETEVPLSLDLQVGESKFVFETRTVQRMELLVLSTLRWRMQAVTPFSFIDYFLNKINNDETASTTSFVLQSIQLILGTIKVLFSLIPNTRDWQFGNVISTIISSRIDFLEFRPSEIAAAVAIAVVMENRTVDVEQALSRLPGGVEKERVVKCIKLIGDLPLINGNAKSTSASLSSVPQSPIGVLDAAACLSYKSDDTTVGSCVNSS